MAVTSEEAFKAWLEAQPREVCVAIAYRVGMRELPRAMDRLKGAERSALATLRCGATSAAVAQRQNAKTYGRSGQHGLSEATR